MLAYSKKYKDPNMRYFNFNSLLRCLPLKFLFQVILGLFNQNTNIFQVSNLQWSNCGPSKDPFKLNQFSISPASLHFPEHVQVTASAKLDLNTSSPIHVLLSIIETTRFDNTSVLLGHFNCET